LPYSKAGAREATLRAECIRRMSGPHHLVSVRVQLRIESRSTLHRRLHPCAGRLALRALQRTGRGVPSCHFPAALFTATARLHALVHVTDALAARCACCTDLRACSAYVCVHWRIRQHEVCGRPADFRAARHHPEVSRLEVLASGLEAMVHRFTFADLVTLQTFTYAVLHFIAECMHCVLLGVDHCGCHVLRMFNCIVSFVSAGLSLRRPLG
jgi:hypothetical protein